VFNNIVALTDPELQGEDSPGCIVVGSEIPNGNSSLPNAPFNNVVVSNNLIADYTFHGAINVGDGGSGIISYGSNIGLWNDVATNNSSDTNGNLVFKNQGNPKVANVANVNFLSMATGSGVFVNYAEKHGDTADFHLVSSATALIGKGTNLSANAAQCPEIMFDRDGKPRPATGAWSVGPYELDD
jgi:hypothetical protein